MWSSAKAVVRTGTNLYEWSQWTSPLTKKICAIRIRNREENSSVIYDQYYVLLQSGQWAHEDHLRPDDVRVVFIDPILHKKYPLRALTAAEELILTLKGGSP